jgi:hypothetical protein
MNMAVMNQKVQKRGAGGVMKGVNALMNAAEEVKRLKVAAKAGIVKPQSILASKAFDQYLGQRLALTPGAADRMVARPGRSREKGGPMFPWLSTVDPKYAGSVWANKGKGKSTQMIGMAEDNPGLIFTPQIGSPEMHRSNQVTFERIMRAFNKAKDEGNLTPELERLYNDRLLSFYKDQTTGKPLFEGDFNISDLSMSKSEEMTFPQRAAIAEVIGGKGLGFSRQEKGQIIPYSKILESTTEPSLIDAPTGSVGPRLFTLSGDRRNDPSIHAAFPEIVGGEDLGIQYDVAPRDVVAHKFVKAIEASKGRPPKSMDWDRNSIIMDINREMVQRLEDIGKKKGGVVQKKADGGLTSDDLVLEERML